MKKLRVGIIGCGTIGSFLARTLRQDFPKEAEIVALCDRVESRARDLAKKLRLKAAITDIPHVVTSSDLVIESASAAVSGIIARRVLEAGKNSLIMSVGGLIGVSLVPPRKWGRIWIPSGALSGVDGLLAAREAGLKSVKLITRKPPEGLRSAPYFSKHKFPVLHGMEERCVFRGPAIQAVKGFPQNINVAAVLSFAGLGPAKTQVEIWTSHAYKHNQHEVCIEAASGSITTVSANVPAPDNPKTSALAAYAAVATLRKIFAIVRIGT